MMEISDDLMYKIETGVSLDTFPNDHDPNRSGHTCLLSLATIAGNLQNIRILKKHGATLDKSVMYGGQGAYMDGASIFLAAEKNNLELVKCVFEGENTLKWANEQPSEQGLFLAIENGNIDMINYFIDTVGVKLSKTGDETVTPCWNWGPMNHFSATTDPDMLSYLETKYVSV